MGAPEHYDQRCLCRTQREEDQREESRIDEWKTDFSQGDANLEKKKIKWESNGNA